MARNGSHYVNGKVDAPKVYEMRISGRTVETARDCPVALYWKARRAVDGNPGVFAEVEAISGFYSHATFSNEGLRDWERSSRAQAA